MQSQLQMKFKSIPGDVHVKAFPPAGELVYARDWMARENADTLFAELMEQVDWESRSIRMFGKRMLQPRKIAFQGEPGVSYAYSGGHYAAQRWHPRVAGLAEALATVAGVEFNCVLLNLYRDGRDSMGWHSDDEPELGRNPVIASISLGSPRRFMLRRANAGKNNGKNGGKNGGQSTFEIEPVHGSLVVMRGDMQAHWQHQVPKTARAVAPRINLTFRRIVRSRP